MKWRQSADGAGKLVLKITDNTTVRASTSHSLLGTHMFWSAQCLKFKTHSSVFLNRFDALNLSLMQKMQNRRPTQASIPHPSSAAQIPASTSAAQTPAEAPSATTPTPSGPAAGGVKKKTPKKRK